MTPDERRQAKRERDRVYASEKRAADPERYRQRVRESCRRSREQDPDGHRNRQLKWKYGITLEQFEQRLEAQGYRCAICKTSDWGGKHGTPNVDHDHVTGEVRGILCHGCNAGVGSFKDPTAMRAAAEYVESCKNSGSGS